jgi:uncharacterized protein
LVEQHKATLGLITMGVARQAWYGAGWAKGTEHRSIRAIFPMYDASFQFAAPKRLGLVSLEGFAGKRIGDGPKAGTTGTYVPGIFKTLGIEAALRNGAWEDNMHQVASGEIDGLAAFAGIPMEGLAELDAQVPLDYLQPSPDQIALVRKEFPELSPSLVPASTYPSLTKDYHTFGIYNFAASPLSLSETAKLPLLRGSPKMFVLDFSTCRAERLSQSNAERGPWARSEG